MTGVQLVLRERPVAVRVEPGEAERVELLAQQSAVVRKLLRRELPVAVRVGFRERRGFGRRYLGGGAAGRGRRGAPERECGRQGHQGTRYQETLRHRSALPSLVSRTTVARFVWPLNGSARRLRRGPDRRQAWTPRTIFPL